MKCETKNKSELKINIARTEGERKNKIDILSITSTTTFIFYILKHKNQHARNENLTTSSTLNETSTFKREQHTDR